MKKFSIIIIALFSVNLSKAQWIDYYASARLGGGWMLSNDFNTYVDYYNKVNNTTVPTRSILYGYKIAAGITLKGFLFGMSQQEYRFGTHGKAGELADGYRIWQNRYGARSGIVGYYTPKRNMLLLEMGIAKSSIKTGFQYRDGFVSYGNEDLQNGSYLANSFIWGLEYTYNRQLKENLFLSFSGGVHFSNPLNMRYEDQLEFKRFGNNYVLYKSADPDPDKFPNPSHLTSKYTMLSFQVGLFYKISQTN